MVLHLDDLSTSSIDALAWMADCYLVCALRALCQHFRWGCHIVHCKYTSQYKAAKRRAAYLLERERNHIFEYSAKHLSWRRLLLSNLSFARLYEQVGYIIAAHRLQLQEEYRQQWQQEEEELENARNRENLQIDLVIIETTPGGN